MGDGQLTLADGRTVGFADYGTPNQTPVLWCHGGPGCRYEPDLVSEAADRAGLRLVGIDRPGYGRSTRNPGRTIGGWVNEGLAVGDHLGIDRFVSVGCSTGGAYALALASSSDRVIAAVACCAVTDMRWRPEHTAEIVPGATLEVIDGLGHFSIIARVNDAVTAALSRAPLSAKLPR